MLFEALDRIKRNAVMTTIVLMFAGLLLLLMPESYIPFLGGAIAFLLAVCAVVSIFDYIASDKALINCIRLTVGLIAGIVGIALFAFDGLFGQFLWWLVGTLPILLAAVGLYYTFTIARRSGRRGWWVLVILFGFLLAFGTMVFWNPWMEDAQAVLRVVGGTLLYSAAAGAVSLIWIWPRHETTEGGA